jgi:cytochrome c-type biogenesis protein CcmH/NrfG
VSDAEKLDRIARLLEEIRDGQKAQLERQTDTLVLQKEQFERTHKLQERAEAIQDRSARLVGRVQRFVPFAMAVVVILIGYVSWLLFRFYR